MRVRHGELQEAAWIRADLSPSDRIRPPQARGPWRGPMEPRPLRPPCRWLTGNRFSDGLPTDELAACYLLEQLALSSIMYLSIAGNRFTGLLSGNVSCGENLRFVDLSLNLLTGSLRPASALTKNSDSKMVLFSRTQADARKFIAISEGITI